MSKCTCPDIKINISMKRCAHCLRREAELAANLLTRPTGPVDDAAGAAGLAGALTRGTSSRRPGARR